MPVPGAATGRIAFHADDAEAAAARGERVILVRIETSPEDIRGMAAAQGILTARGGMTSHAALVARQMGKVCVAGCEPLLIDYGAGQMRVAGTDVVLKHGDSISIDGTTGEVFLGEIATEPSEVVRVLIDRSLDPAQAPVYQQYAQLMKWADRERRLRVRANADQPDQCANAVAFGAEGVGLCRTEHMFFGEGKIGPMREMILAETIEERRAALAKLLPLQRQDFEGIFRVMGGRPVTIRTIDPPLHEFLPHEAADQDALAHEMGIPVERIRARVEALREVNPMLGFRGCRLGNRLSGNHRNAGARDFRGGCEPQRVGRGGRARGDDPARRSRQGAEAPGRHRQAGRRRSDGAEEGALEVLGRHHDRGASRGGNRGRHCLSGGVLFIRYERPHADDAWRVPR